MSEWTGREGVRVNRERGSESEQGVREQVVREGGSE